MSNRKNNKISALDKIFLMLHSDWIESLSNKGGGNCRICIICDCKNSKKPEKERQYCRCDRINAGNYIGCNEKLKELLAEIFEEFKI